MARLVRLAQQYSILPRQPPRTVSKYQHDLPDDDPRLFLPDKRVVPAQVVCSVDPCFEKGESRFVILEIESGSI
jgi:hypothetical protein